MPDQQPDITGVDEKHLMASLSYVGFLVFIPLFLRKNDPFVAFHIRQGLVLLILEVLAVIANAWIPIVGNLIGVLLFIASVIGLIQALQGRRWKIPIIGEIADKFTI